MRAHFLALALAMTGIASTACAENPPVTLSSTKTKFADLMADPQAKAVLLKHIPQLGSKESPFGTQLQDMASDMTLKEIQEATQAFGGGMMTDKILEDIDADLAQIQPRK